ncbi:hypothetical protein JCM10213_001379, partial [Rhodosporidiobolus nylandii]
LEGVNRHFKGKVVAISHMDDCSFAILDPSITMEDVIKVIESFGWTLNPKKTEPPSRRPTHIGCVWDLDSKVVSLKEEKRFKYAKKVRVALKNGTNRPNTLTEIESLVGSLQYCAFIKKDLCPRLRLMYRFRAAYKSRFGPGRKFRHNEITALKEWLSILESGPVAASFADLPSPLDGIFASDASNDALGVFIKLPADPSPLVSAFPLLP